MVDVGNNFIGMRLTVLFHQKLVNPHDNMVLERAFDHLVEQIGCQELVDVSSREVVREWLRKLDSQNTRLKI
jgi:hypothetical protein